MQEHLQDGFDVRFDWGPHAARQAARRGDVVVIVDVLRFSTATASAVHHGASIHPRGYAQRERAAELAASLQAEPHTGGLSPLAFSAADRGRRYLVFSPNGAWCSELARDAVAVLAGALVNASAVAAQARTRAERLGSAVSVIACGELWDDAPGSEPVLRPCLEDYLGAGAILRGLSGRPSPEASLCRDAFLGAAGGLDALLWECASGRELRTKGRGDDVAFSSALDRLDRVPLLTDGEFRAASAP